MRKRFTYANVAATLALVFSMTAGAVAAGRYLITSTSQIKPSVLRALKGNAGKAGATGPAGARGSTGPQGPAGTPGVAGAAVAQGPKGERGETGLPGPTGPQGALGAAGREGPAGTTVLARARSVGAVETTTSLTSPPTEAIADPLTGATWTQGADEVDRGVVEVEVTVPAWEHCHWTGLTDTAYVAVLINGRVADTANTIGTPGSEHANTETVSSEWWTPEPGANTLRTLTAEVWDHCEGGGGHATIKSIKAYVLGAR